MLAAGDSGPRQTLRPLQDAFKAPINDGSDISWASEERWRTWIAAHRPRGLVCGTSDSPEGRAIEFSARKSAAAVGLPVAAIEDFAGNYRDLPGCPTRLLLLESAEVVERTCQRLGTACPPVLALSPARYDPLRSLSATHRAEIRRQWSSRERRGVLWVGQPETADCLQTLESLLPHLFRHRLQLLFKAHPRDAGYRRGAYRDILGLQALSAIDLTANSVEDTLMRAPWLVVTQFSSVAIEAGFYGIPSVNVLLPGAGGDRLIEKKGWGAPPHCLEGAALDVHAAELLPEALETTLNDAVARDRIIRCFDAYFSTASPTTPALVQTIENLFAKREISP
jgi:hypothetical protein